MSKSKTAKAAPKKAAPKKVAAKPREINVGDVVNYVLTEDEATSHNREFPCTVQLEVEKINPNGEHLLKGEVRTGGIWNTGAYYSADKKPGTFH